jgi:hypothetical protein
MFSPTRDQARHLFFDTWAKYQRGEPVAGLEQTALEVMLLHPEYHAILQDPERYRDRDYLPAAGEVNPFLHLSLHLAVAEQLSIDQPAGIVQRHRELAVRLGSEHDALHALVECLGETIWQAQRTGSMPDQRVYFDCLARQAGGQQ